MPKPPLTLIFLADLLSWEREALSSLERCLAAGFEITKIEAGGPKGVKLALREGPAWILSHHWGHAIRSLSLSQDSSVFVSALSMRRSTPFLPSLFWKRLQAGLPRGVKVVAHSPLGSRCLREIEGVEESRVIETALPFLTAPRTAPDRKREIVVGSYCRFTVDSNLNYLLNVMHYVSERAPEIRFHLVGTGPLGSHVLQMARDLGVESKISISNEMGDDPDVVLFHPLQNHHFLPLHIAASRGLPVIANELPGIDQFITDGKEGFLVPVNETKPMAELILRLAADPMLRISMGGKLAQRLTQELGADTHVGKVLGLVSPEVGARARNAA